MNTKIKKLIGNSIVFAIGNLGSKVIGIIMVPLYTFLLTTEEYGVIDLSLTMVSLLLPIVTLSISDALFRFIMDNNYKKKLVISSSAVVLVIMLGLTLITCIFFKFINLRYWYILLILFVQAIQLFLSQLLRGLQYIKEFAINGIIMSLVLATGNVILLYYAKMGTFGYFLSIILTNVISIIYISFFINYKTYFRLSEISSQIVLKLLKYSIPLIPNSIMWWLLNASSRFFILEYLGVQSNGIYAVSNKIPSLLIILQTIFFQAWQLSAMEEENSGDSSIYASKVFDYFQKFMFLCTLILIYISKPIIENFVSKSYVSSWNYIPFLLIGVLFSSLSSFIGTQYLVKKKTSGIMYSSCLGAIINVLSCYILIPILGIHGASLGLLFGFLSVYIYRLISVVKRYDFTININNQILNLILCILMSGIIFLNEWIYVNVLFIFLLFIFFYNNKELFKLIKLK